MFGLLLSYGFFLVFISFVFTPLLMNWQSRLLGRLALRAQQFPKQQFINEMYEGALWLPHKVLSYSSFGVLLGTMLSTTMPITLGIVSASCFLRYAIDRGFFLLRVYQRPDPIDGTLVKFCVRLLPIGLVAKVCAMYLHYAGSPARNFPIDILLGLTVGYASIFFVVGTDLAFWASTLGLPQAPSRDIANFFTHQGLVRSGLVDSYDPLRKDEAQKLEDRKAAKLFASEAERGTRTDRAAMAAASAARQGSSEVLSAPQWHQWPAARAEEPLSMWGALRSRLTTQSLRSLARFSSGADADADVPPPPALDADAPPSRTAPTRRSSVAGADLSRAPSDAEWAAPPTKRLGSSISGADRFKRTIDAVVKLDAKIGTTEEAMHRASTKASTGASRRKRTGDSWRPVVWRNPSTLPVVCMCPNSCEPAHVRTTDLWTEHTSARFGTSRWCRASRLGGATEAHAFGSWVELRLWMETNLRTLISDRTSPSAIGQSGEVAVGSIGSALAVDGSGASALYVFTGMPVTLLAPSEHAGQWMLTVSRDRGEFPNLHWKVLVATERNDFDHLLRLHGCTDERIAAQAIEGRTDAELRRERDADGAVMWQVQCMAAELMHGGEGKASVWTRWVAVLRAGGCPRKIGSSFTNVAQRVDWGHPSHAHADADLAARLAGAYHLVALAGTEHKCNFHVMASLRKGCDWSEQFVYAAPFWPSAYLASGQAPKDMLLSLIAYCNHSWTLVFTHATTAAALGQEEEEEEEDGRFSDAVVSQMSPLGAAAAVFLRGFGFSKKSGITPSMSYDKAFSVLDKDGSGSISVGELKAALVKEGSSEVLEAEIESLIDQVDVSGDGELQLDEFETFWDLFQANCEEAAARKPLTPGRLKPKPKAKAKADPNAVPPVRQKVLVHPTWPASEVGALISKGFTITTAARGPGDALMSRVVVVVLTKSPSTISPRMLGTFGSNEQIVDTWRSNETPNHRNWAAAGGVTIRASQTAAETDDDVRLVRGAKLPPGLHRNVSCAPNPRKPDLRPPRMPVPPIPTHGGVQLRPAASAGPPLRLPMPPIPLPPLALRTTMPALTRARTRARCFAVSTQEPPGATQCAIVNVLDPDLASFWSSGELLEPGEPVTITIDLGATRTVDSVMVLWGDVEPLPMPKAWELVGGTVGSVWDGPDDPHTLNPEELGLNLPTKTPGVFQSKTHAHVAGVSHSLVTLPSPKDLRVLQLRLVTPQPKHEGGGRNGFSIRRVLVLGPWTEAASEAVKPVASEEAPTELRIDGDVPIGLTQQEVIMLEQLKLNVESNVPKRSKWSKLTGSVLGDLASGQGEQLDGRSLPDLTSGVAGDSLATQMASELLIDGDLPIGLTPDEARELEQLTQLSELRIDGDLPIGLTPEEARELEQLKASTLPASASPPPRMRGSSGGNQLAIKGDQGRSSGVKNPFAKPLAAATAPARKETSEEIAARMMADIDDIASTSREAHTRRRSRSFVDDAPPKVVAQRDDQPSPRGLEPNVERRSATARASKERRTRDQLFKSAREQLEEEADFRI